MEATPEIIEAIDRAIRAGVFWRAGRLATRRTARQTWERLAQEEHEISTRLLAQAVERLGV